jgi:hypothetical protein
MKENTKTNMEDLIPPFEAIICQDWNNKNKELKVLTTLTTDDNRCKSKFVVQWLENGRFKTIHTSYLDKALSYYNNI